MEDMMIRVLKESWLEFLEQLKPLLLATSPWIIAVMALDATYILFSEELNSSVILLVLLSEIILKAMIVFAGLQVLFRSRGCSVEMTTGKLIIYGVAATFTGIATVLGMMLFVIPGIVVMAASFFMPVYILKENQGPIEAIASGVILPFLTDAKSRS
ncbi:MAG: hypothetical protein OIF51_15930 [Cellvibrionaceae bacterium]|nr:hypothetical protein [Cellvibrionaceae bacterium]